MKLIDVDKLKPYPFDPNYISADEIEKATVIDIPQNATNGNVIKAMFPDADYEVGKQFVHTTNINSIGELSIPLDWWNAPYKAGEQYDRE